MPGLKRPRSEEADADTGADDVHPARKQRLEDGAGDAEFKKIFNDLRDEVQSTRLEATKKLVKTLSENPDNSQALDYSVTRLVKGVCSGAKAARPGFSIALVEVLRLGFASGLKMNNIVDKVNALTNPEIKASGDERRNHLIGRRFAYQAIIQSGVLLKASADDAKYLFGVLADLAAEKEWLRGECGAMLHELLVGREGSQLPNETLRTLIDSWISKGLLKSPEGVALWLTLKKNFPEVKLPKGHWNHNNPLSSQERPKLTQILFKNALDQDVETNGAAKKKSPGARQINPSFAWQIILAFLYEEDDAKKFTSFWEDCVAKPMFSATTSTERRNLGLQIFTKALTTAPTPLLGQLIHANIIKCIVDQRAKSDRYLFEAAKTPLNQMAKRAESDSEAASVMLCKLLAVLPSSFDKLIKTTIESLLSAPNAEGLSDVVESLANLCVSPGMGDTLEAEQKRRFLADMMLSLIRLRRSQPAVFFSEDESSLADWLRKLLRSLTNFGYTTDDNTSPPLAESSHNVFRERLMSSLGHLVGLPIRQAVLAPSVVVEILYESRKSLVIELDTQSSASLKDARKHLKDAAKKARGTESSTASVMQAFQLLLALGMLQVYKREPDSLGVLDDIVACYQSPKDDGDASTMIVELLLSFISKPSALFRKLAEQVFSAFAPEVTPEGIQSMIDILSQQESLAGQQQLFDQDGESGGENEDVEDNESAMDVEDASDIELVNGEIADDPSNDDEQSGSEEDSASGSADEDEEAVFDHKLAAALGTTGMDDVDSSDSGSDMDDEQMMALEPHLTNIFKEKKKMSTSKKQENKDAKENIVNFKNRVLDLLSVYVKSQHANPLALDLIHPILTLTRTTTSQPTAKKGLEVLELYFDTCKKHKALPTLESSKPVFKLLGAVHEEMRLGGSKLHAAACSRSSQFLAKILVAKDAKYWKKVAEMYLSLQEEWRRDLKSKIYGSVFNDWHSFSMQRA